MQQKLSIATRAVALVFLFCANNPGSAFSAEREDSRYAGRPLVEVLEEHQARGLSLIYSSDLVRADLVVETEPRGRSPLEILTEILLPHHLKIEQGPGQTLLIVADPETRQTLRGLVRTQQDHIPLPSVRVRISGTQVQAMTDPEGRFQIQNLEPGTYTLEVHFPGWEVQTFEGVRVSDSEDLPVHLDVVIRPELIEQVVVRPRPEIPPPGLEGTRHTLGQAELIRQPSLGNDLHRSLTVVPGVVSGDRSAQLSVRGGDPNEVKVILDGLEVYEPFHLKDFHSISGIINSRAIGKVEVLSGAFPAQYGNHMSGVLELSSIPANGNNESEITASLVNSGVLTSGRFHDGRGQWLASARAWYPDRVVDTIQPDEIGFDPNYYDLHGRVQMDLGNGKTLSGNVLGSKDDLRFLEQKGEIDLRARSDSRYAWATLSSIWSSSLYSETLVSTGALESDREGEVREGEELTADLEDRRSLDSLGLKQTWTHDFSKTHQVAWGMEVRRMRAHYDYTRQSLTEDPPLIEGTPAAADQDLHFSVTGTQYGAHFSQKFQVSSPMSVELGLRWDHQTYTDETQVSPRLNVAFEVGEESTFQMGWGRFYQPQGIHQLKVEDGASDFFPAQLAEHYVLGFQRVGMEGWQFRADAYLKRMSDLESRYENIFKPYSLLSELRRDRAQITPDSAEAKGLELYLGRDTGRSFSWWSSYALASVEDKIDGEEVPRSWDQRHTVRFGLHYQRREIWDVNVFGIYHTGWPTTPLSGEEVLDDMGGIELVPVVGSRNSERYPDYYRVDFKARRHFQIGNGTLTCFLEVLNLTDRENVCCVEDFVLESRPDGSVAAFLEDGYWQERIPTIGVTWKFSY